MTTEAEEKALVEWTRFVRFLAEDCGYRDLKPLPDGRIACIYPLMFTHAIVVCTVGNFYGVDDRWCYAGYEKAKRYLDAWDGTGEPDGWHRHPATDRRREIDYDPMATA